MGSHGIKDRVAIVGMGCTPFGEHWNKGTDDLLVDAAEDTFASAGITKDDVDAYWLGTAMSGMSGMALARPLQLHDKPVTHVENFCATASEAMRNAAYSVASGAYDVAMAIGVEKVKDSGYQGLVGAAKTPTDGTGRTLTAAAMFAMCSPGYGKKYGLDDAQMREVLGRIAWKNHYNGARNPRAQFRKEVSMETICNAPLMAGGLGVYDCSGVADGSAAAIIVRAEDARQYTDKPIYIKALSLVAGNCSGQRRPRLRLHDVPRDRGDGPRRVRAGRHHEPARAARDGRGARLLHHRRAPHLRGPAVRRARHRVEGSARRHLRPRGRAARQPRRRSQELRPPGRARRGCGWCSRRGCSCAARRRPSARSRTPTAVSRSRTTSAATPARWSRSSRSSATSSADRRRRPAPVGAVSSLGHDAAVAESVDADVITRLGRGVIV